MKIKESRVPLRKKQFVKKFNNLLLEIEKKQLKLTQNLVSFKKSDWVNLILATSTPVPEGFDKISEYAEQIRKLVETSFPTQILADMITRNDFQVIRESIEKFLRNEDCN